MNTDIKEKIKLRSKFKNLLTDTDHSNISNILGTFEKFCQKEPDTVLSMLWHLTYNEHYAFAIFNIFKLDFECIPAIKLRDEMRYQYNTIHPGFLTVKAKSQEIQKAYETLKNKSDLIVSTVVYRHCCSKIFLTESEISRIIYLLSSNDDKNFFGGIRSLGFTKAESIYLKPFHKEIGNLFKALCDANQQDSKNLPFKDVQQLVTAAPTEAFVEDQSENSVTDHAEASMENKAEASVKDDKLPVESSHEEVKQDIVTPISSSFKPLTAEEIMANTDTFTSFAKNNNFDSLTLLLTAGFDLNQVMSKKEEISNFLDAVTALN